MFNDSMSSLSRISSKVSYPSRRCCLRLANKEFNFTKMQRVIQLDHGIIPTKLFPFNSSYTNLPFTSMRKKCQYLEFFWSTFSRIRNVFGNLSCKSPFVIRMRENTDKKTPNTDTFYAVFNAFQFSTAYSNNCWKVLKKWGRSVKNQLNLLVVLN